MTRFLSLKELAAAILTAGVLAGCTAIPAGAGGEADPLNVRPAIAAQTPDRSATFEADRRAILAMAGTFEVAFDFRETAAFAPGYTIKSPKLSAAREVVRVIEDTGSFISLQHTLVVGRGEPAALKHWRQDWQYEPKEVLVYVGGNTWQRRPVPEGERKGRWSQEVFQVEDSPRYGAVGVWSHQNGVSEWTPPPEWRPLPRREATTRSDYQVMIAVNRHAVTPDGWVHEQDNSKLALDGRARVLVREVGINTYRRSDSFEAGVADAYTVATADFWAGVRQEWTRLEASAPEFGLTVQGEPEPLYMPLLELADKVQDKSVSLDKALDEARSVIAQLTTTRPEPLEARIAKHMASKTKSEVQP